MLLHTHIKHVNSCYMEEYIYTYMLYIYLTVVVGWPSSRAPNCSKPGLVSWWVSCVVHLCKFILRSMCLSLDFDSCTYHVPPTDITIHAHACVKDNTVQSSEGLGRRIVSTSGCWRLHWFLGFWRLVVKEPQALRIRKVLSWLGCGRMRYCLTTEGEGIWSVPWAEVQ